MPQYSEAHAHACVKYVCAPMRLSSAAAMCKHYLGGGASDFGMHATGAISMICRALHQRAATAATAAASKHSSTPMSSVTATSQARSAHVKDKAPQ